MVDTIFKNRYESFIMERRLFKESNQKLFPVQDGKYSWLCVLCSGQHGYQLKMKKTGLFQLKDSKRILDRIFRF